MYSEILLDKVYEAASFPDRWPLVLEEIAGLCGAMGATVFAAGDGGAYNTASPGIEALVSDYIQQGWMEKNERGAPLVAALHPGFVTDTDVRSIEEMLEMPVYRDFLIPAGAGAGAGTAVQGAHHDLMIMTVEGFQSHRAARDALPVLDALRPHIARSLSLMSRIQLSRAQAMVQGLATLGAAAAVVGRDGGLRACNHGFETRFGNAMVENRLRLRFLDTLLDDALGIALSASGRTSTEARSVFVRGGSGALPCVVHILPLRRVARDLFESDGVLLIVAEAANNALPNADILRLLFDLTPAESRIARHLMEGLTLERAAVTNGVTYGTAKSHLRSIFSKTGVHRQSELLRLFSGYGMHGMHA